jgi:hypothetical protein
MLFATSKARVCSIAIFFVLWCSSALAQGPSRVAGLPGVGKSFENIAARFRQYEVILRPDRSEPEWWAGAPSVVVDPQGVFWMACRMRTGDGERGLRGYEIRILKSGDGVRFQPVARIRREDVPIPGFERPALLRDPKSGLFKLYGCGPWKGGPWGIFKFDDARTPELFRADSAKLVIGPLAKSYPRDVVPEEYKDPVVVYAEGAYHAYVIGYLRRLERIYHFQSPDGETWRPVDSPYQAIMPLSGWHDFFVRPAAVLPLGIGYLFVYEGSKTDWYDPVYNIATGLGWTFDLHGITDLTPDAPLLASSTPTEHFATFRYSCWLLRSEQLWVYAEVACRDRTHEIRLYRVPLAR